VRPEEVLSLGASALRVALRRLSACHQSGAWSREPGGKERPRPR
jgi:hypothetical protein